MSEFYKYDPNVDPDNLNNVLMYIQSHKWHPFLRLWPSLVNLESFTLDDYHGIPDTLITLRELCAANGLNRVYKQFQVSLVYIFCGMLVFLLTLYCRRKTNTVIQEMIISHLLHFKTREAKN